MITEANFQEAAKRLGCEVAAIKAVCEVEAPRGGFLVSGAPTILFERHLFSRLTKGVYDRIAPDISNRKTGGYLGGQREHDRLAKAAALDRYAALMSASWGRFQILGQNFTAAGFNSLQHFINAMYWSEQEHLAAFVSFILYDWRLAMAIRAKDFTTFARIYNGPGYAKNQYDKKMLAAYRRFS